MPKYILNVSEQLSCCWNCCNLNNQNIYTFASVYPKPVPIAWLWRPPKWRDISRAACISAEISRPLSIIELPVNTKVWKKKTTFSWYGNQMCVSAPVHSFALFGCTDKHGRTFDSHVRSQASVNWYSKFTCQSMMTSLNGNIFSVTGHLCGEFTGPRWIPHTKASDAELWCVLLSAPEYTAE